MAYPKGASRDQVGLARLSCVPNRAGWLAGCVVSTETPVGGGFGAAALSLAPRFRLTKEAAATYSDGIELPIRFEPLPAGPPWRELKVRDEGFHALGLAGPFYPDRAYRAEVEGEVMADCRVGDKGVLNDCRVVSVVPGDMNFQDAFIAMAKRGHITAAATDTPAPSDGIWRFRVPFELKGKR